MKNMFKMMDVALLAGAMLFTACKKDKEDTTPTNTPTYTVTVTYGGETWKSNNNLLYFIDSDGLNLQGEEGDNGFQVICGENAENYSFGVGNYGVVIWKGSNQVNGTTNGYINITAIDLQSATKTITAKVRCEMNAVESGDWLDIDMANAVMVEGVK